MTGVELLVLAGAVLAVVVALFGVGALIINNLLYICEPNEVLVFSGVRAGQRRYLAVKGGRAVRRPLFERVDKLDLTNMIIDVTVQGAYSKGGIPLLVQGVANVKIAGHDPVLSNAVERLLGKPRDEIMRIAKEVLEGNLRGVLAQLTPEAVNEDKIAFAEQLLDEAEPDLARLGLVLDTMKIQNVADDRGYLDSLGRQQSAEIIKKSRIAEARAKANALIQDAENRKRARIREIDADTEIAKAQAERRVIDAQTKAVAMVAEAEGRVEAEIAKATAALDAEEERMEQVRRQLEADVLEPARASMEAGISEAEGRASRILEEGRATARVLREMTAVWQDAGPYARDIFLMQKFQSVMGSLVDTIGHVKVDKITMLPATDGDNGSTAVQAVRLVEELKGALGIDLPKMLEQVTSGRASDAD